ncbi:MAG: hypothetical protein K2X43_24545 [Hyphomonadaceae bacterium]|jgi:hypothetical protein|nr:hypothetical protein [Hyphomonadaceae bacterium]
MATQPSTLSNRADAVTELFTEARVDVLNAALADRGVSADRIITILHVPGQTVANPAPAQFRVLYRAA